MPGGFAAAMDDVIQARQSQPGQHAAAGIGAGLDHEAVIVQDAGGGDVLLQATGNVLLAQVVTADADVRIQSTTASILPPSAAGSESYTLEKSS